MHHSESVSTSIIFTFRKDAFHPDRTDNEVVRLDLAGSGFLRLLRALRVILLQDSVVLRPQFPHHPLWTDPLFDCEEYRRFAARAASSLANVATPDELTMQKFWPAHEAVAKLRHEAAIATIEPRPDTRLRRLCGPSWTASTKWNDRQRRARRSSRPPRPCGFSKA